MACHADGVGALVMPGAARDWAIRSQKTTPSTARSRSRGWTQTPAPAHPSVHLPSTAARYLEWAVLVDSRG